MKLRKKHNSISLRIQAMADREKLLRANNQYFFNQPITELHGAARALINGREMGMFASYSYLGLVGHPRINAAAQAAVERYGTGTHGVRFLAGTLDLHQELEETIAGFKKAEASVTYSSGYVTNLTAISTLAMRGDVVISDKLNHASIVDGCMLSGAEFARFQHNDMKDLERLLKRSRLAKAKIVVADAVFSMDGDIVDLPTMAALCRKYGAWLMIDEAHSVGVLGKSGRGIEEHFGLEGVVDIKMGTLSKTIPAAGGYIAGKKDMIDYLRHASRAYIFSAALTPAQAGAANEAFKVILDEPWRVEKLCENARRFTSGLQQAGFNTMRTETAIVPVLCGSDENAFAMTYEAQNEDVFVLPVISPAVPQGLARLRATVTAAHENDDIDHAVEVLERAGKKIGLL